MEIATHTGSLDCKVKARYVEVAATFCKSRRAHGLLFHKYPGVAIMGSAGYMFFLGFNESDD